MSVGTSMGLRTGWDFTREVHRRKAWKLVDEELPYLLVGSPPCTVLNLARIEHQVARSRSGMEARVRQADEGSKGAHKVVLHFVQEAIACRAAFSTRASVERSIVEPNVHRGANARSESWGCDVGPLPFRA